MLLESVPQTHGLFATSWLNYWHFNFQGQLSSVTQNDFVLHATVLHIQAYYKPFYWCSSFLHTRRGQNLSGHIGFSKAMLCFSESYGIILHVQKISNFAKQASMKLFRYILAQKRAASVLHGFNMLVSHMWSVKANSKPRVKSTWSGSKGHKQHSAAFCIFLSFLFSKRLEGGLVQIVPPQVRVLYTFVRVRDVAGTLFKNIHVLPCSPWERVWFK